MRKFVNSPALAKCSRTSTSKSPLRRGRFQFVFSLPAPRKCYAYALLSLVVWFAQPNSVLGQNKPDSKEPSKAQVLETKQKQLVQRFQKLEELFLRMSELEADSNPTHAGLLMQAAQLSKQLGTRQQLLSASDLIAKGQLNRAIQEQVTAHENLQKLLELLQSENRGSRIRDERAKLEEIVNELRRLESIQRSLRGRTESGQDMKQAGSDQKNLNEQIENLDQSIKDPEQKDSPKANESQSPDEKNKSNPSGQSEGESKESDSKPADDADSKPADSKPAESESKEKQEGQTEKDGKAESKDSSNRDPDRVKSPTDEKNQRSPSENQSPAPPKNSEPKNSPSEESSSDDSSSDEASQDGESSESDQSESPSKPKSKEAQAKERVQRAKSRMKKAQERLEKEDREDAVKEQRAAEKELREAVDELEKILRQLREEEIERSLVDLETRIRKMHELQKSVRVETEKLDKLEGASRERTLEIQANKLVIEQGKVVMEGQRALLLLQDEGSSTAFPEAMDQVVRDAQLIAKRIAALNVSSGTQAIEDEVIASLEELLASLKQVQKEREDEKNKQQQQAGGGAPPPSSGDQPLVDKLAELRLLKTLQLRINRRTQSLAKQLEISNDNSEQTESPEIREELNDLADRQLNILEVTREILVKENQN